jgi:hypothetical protein
LVLWICSEFRASDFVLYPLKMLDVGGERGAVGIERF